jgi:hypothetical protein
MPFEEQSIDIEERKAHIKKSEELEQVVRLSTDWQFLAGHFLATFRLDKNGNAEITDYMGMPFKRDDVVRLMLIAHRYLEQHSSEEIYDLIHGWYEQFNSPHRFAFQKSHPRKQVTGHIYLLSGGGYFKIGKTTNLSIRSQQISLQLPFEVTLVHSISTDDIGEAERYWHTKFKSKRLNGEWFSLVDEDLIEFSSIREM